MSDHTDEKPNTVTYISIGNSDDKLSQVEWADFHGSVDRMLRNSGWTMHGTWTSLPTAWWQNACWAVEVPDGSADDLAFGLGVLAKRFRQDSIVTVTGTPSFVLPVAPRQPDTDEPLPTD